MRDRKKRPVLESVPADGTMAARSPERKTRHVPFRRQLFTVYTIPPQYETDGSPRKQTTKLPDLTPDLAGPRRDGRRPMSVGRRASIAALGASLPSAQSWEPLLPLSPAGQKRTWRHVMGYLRSSPTSRHLSRSWACRLCATGRLWLAESFSGDRVKAGQMRSLPG